MVNIERPNRQESSRLQLRFFVRPPMKDPSSYQARVWPIFRRSKPPNRFIPTSLSTVPTVFNPEKLLFEHIRSRWPTGLKVLTFVHGLTRPRNVHLYLSSALGLRNEILLVLGLLSPPLTVISGVRRSQKIMRELNSFVSWNIVVVHTLSFVARREPFSSEKSRLPGSERQEGVALRSETLKPTTCNGGLKVLRPLEVTTWTGVFSPRQESRYLQGDFHRQGTECDRRERTSSD